MNNRNRFPILCLILLTVAACKTGPEYEPPLIDPPGGFVSQQVFEKINATIQAQASPSDEYELEHWWEGFNDPELNQLVDEALSSSYRIAIQQARVDAAEAAVRQIASEDELQALYTLDPGIDQVIRFGEVDHSSFSGGAGGSLSFTLPLDLFGENEREVEAAIAEWEGQQAALQGTILDISADVVVEFLRLRGNQRQLSLLQSSVRLQEQTLSIVRSRYQAGLAPELDLRRAEAAVENLRAEIPPLQESILTTRNRIATLTGHFPGEFDVMLADETDDIPSYQFPIEETLPLEMLSSRPDVRQAEALFRAATAEIGVAMTAWYPTFQLGQQLSLSGVGSTGDPSLGLFIAALNMIIQQVVLDGGRRQATVDRAIAQSEEALSQYYNTLLRASGEVEAALASIQSSLNRQIPLSRSVEASTRSAFQAEVLYRQGLASFLDVVDAQRELASAQQRLASTRTAYAAGIAQLFRVLGTPVQPTPDTTGDGNS